MRNDAPAAKIERAIPVKYVPETPIKRGIPYPAQPAPIKAPSVFAAYHRFIVRAPFLSSGRAFASTGKAAPSEKVDGRIINTAKMSLTSKKVVGLPDRLEYKNG